MKRILLCTSIVFAILFAEQTSFDGFNAFAYLYKQVEMGYRIPGSKDHLACRDWIIETSSAYADTVIVQKFKAFRPVTKDTVWAYNIIVRFRPHELKRVMLSTHWDTRPYADLDRFHPNQPVPGANDGASGTAVLLELQRHIKDLPIDVGIDLIFWDAEDMGIAGSGMYFCQGSEYYASDPVYPVPQYGILIDMIGDSDLKIPIEINSMKYAPDLVLEVWKIAKELGYQHIFKQILGPEVYDDHVPLNLIAGIPTINIIDFHYVYQGKNLWHTIHDTPSYCSPESLQTIGNVLLTWLLRQ